MKTTSAYLLGILFTILIGTLLYWKLCSSCRLDSATMGEVTNETPSRDIEKNISPIYSLSFKQDGYAFSSSDNFSFKNSSPSFIMPISSEMRNGLASLKEYLIENPGKFVEITGYYTSQEENFTPFDNLGLARANSVKNHFVMSGIPTSQVQPFGQLSKEMVSDKDIFFGPVSYEIKAILKDKDSSSTEAP
ncbi:OmpA family protein [Flagellimonas allohymeniacidonis]|uniref:OmpA-like domain-containing protein n=1 Tax=Flagellimonas allohymeniacidonis TaxID=2517819 RepID=A0A4Q8QBJ9_9FLAO|nr:OmpA family protein [Allomuricauda hymeniacidonis]TAI47742.1 hypothetical protein EW142_13875 [Allomuricauda hymeniacidonis]